MPEANIELLIRKRGADEDGFSIMTVPSGLVYAGYRPRRIDPSGYTAAVECSPVDGRSYCVLKAAGSDKYLSLSDREQFLWGLMDGSRPIKEIAAAYFYKFGSLDFEAIKKLLARLREAGLVEFVPASRLRVALDRSKRPWARRLAAMLSRLEFRLEDADGWVGRQYRRVGYLLVSRTAMALYVLLSAAGILAFGRFESAGQFSYRFFLDHPVVGLAALLLSLYPITAVHELYHALACKRFGRRVHAFGFTLWEGFYPGFYTDVSDMYLSPRPDRIYVTIAGPLSTMAIAAAFIVPAAINPDSAWSEPLYQLGRLNLFIAFLTLYPFQFLKMDGYHLLVDLLGFPGLRERAFSFIKGLPSRIRAERLIDKSDIIMAAYFLLSAISIAGFTAYFLGAI